MEQRRQDIIDAVERVDTGDGVVILTDMFGGTPSNLAISVMSRPKVEVIAGINLPMLIKLASVRESAPRRGGCRGAGSRPQIHQRRQPGPQRQMSARASADRRIRPRRARVPIVNKKGLHARASAKFVQTVEQFDAAVTVTAAVKLSAAPRSWA